MKQRTIVRLTIHIVSKLTYIKAFLNILNWRKDPQTFQMHCVEKESKLRWIIEVKLFYLPEKQNGKEIRKPNSFHYIIPTIYLCHCVSLIFLFL